MQQTIIFFKKEWKALRIGFLHAFFSGYGQTFFLSLFSGFIIEEFGLTRSQYGGVYSLATLISAFTLPIPGAWIDKWDLRTYSLSAAVLLIFACILFAWSPNLMVLGISLYLMRLSGQGLISHVNGTTMSRYFGKDRGKALSISNLGYPVAEALVPIFTYMIIDLALGWRSAPIVMGLLVLLVFIPLSWSWISQNPQMNAPANKTNSGDLIQESSDWTRRQALSHPFFYLILLNYLAPPFLITGFFIQQSSLSEVFEWGLKDFSIALIWFSIFRFVGSLFSGPLLDHWDAKRLIFFYTLPMGIGCLTTALGVSPLVLFASCGLTAGAGGSIKTALLNEIYGSNHLGAIRSTATSIMAISTGVSPFLFGLILDVQFNFKDILWSSSLFILVGLISQSIAFKFFLPKKD